MSEHYVIAHTRKLLEREKQPKGMSVHDGKMKMEISHVDYMIKEIARLTAENQRYRKALERIRNGNDKDNFPLMAGELKHIARAALEG